MATETPILRIEHEPLTAQAILTHAFPSCSPGRSAPTPSKRTFYVLSQDAAPRWIIPRNSRLVRPVLQNWRAYKFKSRVQWDLLVLACEMNVLPHVPGIAHEVAEIDLSYWHRRLDRFSDSWQILIYVGNESHTRKASVFFVDGSSAVRAIVKLPLKTAAIGAILDEANVLRRLHWLPGAPQVLFADEETGIAAQTWIDGKPVPRRFTQAHVELLAQLAEHGKSTRLGDHHDAVAARVDGLTDFPLESPLLERALRLLENTRTLPAFVEHGDFAPWNLRRLSDGRLSLFDWEWAVETALPWQDVCHYFYIQDFVFHGDGRVWRTLSSNSLLRDYLDRFDIPSEVLPGLTMHYLLRSLCLDWTYQYRNMVAYKVRQIRALLEA